MTYNFNREGEGVDMSRRKIHTHPLTHLEGVKGKKKGDV